MKLTKNFKSEEFGCNGKDLPKNLIKNCTRVAEVLEVIREFFQKPVIISSGYRTLSHNKKIGGKENSKHLKALAADFRINGVKHDRISKAIAFLTGIGKLKQIEYTYFNEERNFTHIQLYDNKN
jgi:hypothetical protein